MRIRSLLPDEVAIAVHNQGRKARISNNVHDGGDDAMAIHASTNSDCK
jgi:hypothetical protein